MGSKYEQGQDALYQRELFRIARAVMALTDEMDDWRDNGLGIMELRLQGPLHTGGGYRVIIKARNEQGDPFVAFRNGSTVQECLAAVASGMADGSIQVKPETPYKPKS